MVITTTTTTAMPDVDPLTAAWLVDGVLCAVEERIVEANVELDEIFRHADGSLSLESSAALRTRITDVRESLSTFLGHLSADLGSESVDAPVTVPEPTSPTLAPLLAARQSLGEAVSAASTRLTPGDALDLPSQHALCDAGCLVSTLLSMDGPREPSSPDTD